MSNVECMSAQAAFVRRILEPLGYVVTGDGSENSYWVEKDGRCARVMLRPEAQTLSAATCLAHTVGLMFGSEPWSNK